MTLSREQLDARLENLNSQLPKVASEDDATFDYDAFQEQAQQLIDLATEADAPYVHERIACLLASAGLVPSETEGQDCFRHASPRH
jgi:hypothetical protein